MSMPLHPELTFADSRAISEAGFRHTAQLGTVTTVRYPNGEEATSIEFGSAITCRLKTIGTRTADIAAAQGVKAQWSLVFKSATAVTIGQQVIVRGTTDGVAWQRLVEITADLGLTGRVHRQTTAIDVELNQ
jgi:hypothetical protein